MLKPFRLGRGSYEDRTEMLRLIVDLVEATYMPIIPSGALTNKQRKIYNCQILLQKDKLRYFLKSASFSMRMFKFSLTITSTPEFSSPSCIGAGSFQDAVTKVDDLASKHAYKLDEDYKEAESQNSTLDAYDRVPQLHGFGPAANCLLEAYKMLLKLIPSIISNLVSYYHLEFLGSLLTDLRWFYFFDIQFLGNLRSSKIPMQL
ncbi:hypothetical protein MLD38_001231 [Melastoma candidum]|uniref:Uncharacterized protein n=1 Tax=Melastoma candidum TaxID=119954 RepID=A0ACB9SEJ1_9MYRT|nr:hypothetical protein MLD38_001231 [Melastoma candidum]